jgi:hypothetical protein
MQLVDILESDSFCVYQNIVVHFLICSVVLPPFTVSASSGCSPPSAYEEDPWYVIQYCNDGIKVTDTQDGSVDYVNASNCRAGGVILADC